MNRAVVNTVYGEVSLKVHDRFHAAGDAWQIIKFDSELVACKDFAGIINWFDPVFVGERLREEAAQ